MWKNFEAEKNVIESFVAKSQKLRKILTLNFFHGNFFCENDDFVRLFVASSVSK